MEAGQERDASGEAGEERNRARQEGRIVLQIFRAAAIEQEGFRRAGQRIKEHLQLDYQIGEIIRTDIIPRAVLYYTDEMYHPEDDTE